MAYNSENDKSIFEDDKAVLEKKLISMQELLVSKDRELLAFKASTCWRLTVPLRVFSRALNWPQLRLFLVRVLRWGYCCLPLSAAGRYRLKSAVFLFVGPLFRNSVPYQNWLAFRRGDLPAEADGMEDDVCQGLGRLALSDNPYKKFYASAFMQAAGPKGLRLDYVPLAADSIDSRHLDIRLIAFYLPQFHPIAENNEWWGLGFTEWTNVSKAVPQFEGHYQPHLPGELGFYDLRLIDVMRRQVQLAKQYGLAGFCFHYYWFSGRRLLELPLNQFLANRDIDFPFCICWANENWSRRWDGSEQSLLMAQVHTPETDEAFIRDVAELFLDSRYIRVAGKPVLIIYRVSLLPEPKSTALRWRNYCREHGFGEIHLVCAQSFEVTDPREYGFDAAVEFPPHQVSHGSKNHEFAYLNPEYKGNICDYREMARYFCAKRETPYALYRTVAPGWDNEARKPGRGTTFHYSSPAAYAEWLDSICRQTVKRLPVDQRLVFVNAWNEWGEGAHLEPDRCYGYAYLHASANVLREYSIQDQAVVSEIQAARQAFCQRNPLAVIAHIDYPDLIGELRQVIEACGRPVDLIVSVPSDISLSNIRVLREAFPEACLLQVRNRGRDVFPFLQALEISSQYNYQALCKIHGNKSLHLSDGVNNRRYLFSSLLSVDALHELDILLSENPQLGLFAPPQTLVSLAVPDRNVHNREWLDRLLKKLGVSYETGQYHFDFVAGSMFWFRPEALEKLLALRLSERDFERELGQIDGTLAYALDRLIVFVASQAGFSTQEFGGEHATNETGAGCERPVELENSDFLKSPC